MNAPDTPFRFDAALAAAADRVEAKVVAWRRDLHEHPELGNREVRTAGLVAKHLRALGLDEVREKGHGDSIDWDRVAQFRPYGGIRIEDDVVCTADAPLNLTREALDAQG